jgi:hypothetical protein
MNRTMSINFVTEKNGRKYVFTVEDNSPIADAFEAVKELLVEFSNLHEQMKPAPEIVEVEPIKES